MSFKVPVPLLNKREFVMAVQRLNKARLPFAHAFKLKSLSTKLDQAMDDVTRIYLEIVKKHVELDEKGDIIPKKLEEDVTGPDGKVIRKAGEVIPNSYIPKSEEAAEALEKEVGEFMNGGIEIKFSKLPIEALNDVEISAEELEFLEPILEISEDVQNNVVSIKKK